MWRARLKWVGFVAFGVVCAIVSSAGAARADVYLISDEEGERYFANEPPTDPTHKILKRYALRSGSRASASPLQSFIEPREAEPSPVAQISREDLYDSLIEAAAKRSQLSPLLVKAIIQVESGFNPLAVSKKGASGLMQLMPATAREMSVKRLFNPKDNINGGVGYFRKMLDLFHGDVELALAAYNAGPTNVINYRGVPPFPETELYITKVLRAYGEYSGLYDGPLYVAAARRGALARSNWSNKTVYYQYVDERGDVVFTDMPIGAPRVLGR